MIIFPKSFFFNLAAALLVKEVYHRVNISLLVKSRKIRPKQPIRYVRHWEKVAE
jgi:hypothetical protein